MNVLVDATALASGHRWRGIGNYVRHLTAGLAERFPDSTSFLTLGTPPHELEAARIVPIASGAPSRWDELWPLYGRRLRQKVAASGSTLYHFTSAEASIGGDVLPTIATVYDLIPVEYPNRGVDPRNIWRRLLYRLYLRRLHSARHLIAISRSTATALTERLGVPAERITVIPLGIDEPEYVERAKRKASSLRGRYRLPPTYWLTVTSPNPNKGWPDLLRSLARVQELGCRTPLVVAGHWLDEHRRKLLDEAGRLGVSSLVQYLGFVPDDDLPALYSEALGFVFPSRREGFGLPVLEAMAVGTAVIVSDDPALQDLVDDAGLTFPRGDAAALADQMHVLAADDELRSRLGAQAARRAALFTWDQTINATAAVYRALSFN